jgi:glycosyltransferase involved in cell wall biosynthesis
VVHPPLATGTEFPRAAPAGPPTALFVAHLARDENDRAASWLLTEIWPTVLARCPRARLRIVGAGASEQLERLVAECPSATLAGFVDDLEPEYAAAWACVVPLRHGAGVKFKTLEALLHDVPVVTTSVGAEGIDGPDLFAGLAEDASTLADRLADTLLRPEAHRDRSEGAQAWVRDNYGPDRFAAAIRSSYGRTPMSR